MKKVWVLVLFSLLLVAFICSVIIAADSSSTDLYGDTDTSWISQQFKKWHNLWLNGGDLTAVGNIFKYLALILVAILSYSALEFVAFPKNALLRGLVAVIVGILATFLFTNKELFTILQSYKALGVTLTVFLPILILGFFTLVVASKASPIGIFLQKIMWVIYSVYLFIKTAALAIITQYVQVTPDGTSVVLKTGADNIPTKIPGWLSALLPATKEEMAKMLSQNDTTIVYVLLVVSVAVFVIMVLGNRYVNEWIEKEKRESEFEGQKGRMERSANYDKLRAEQMQKG